MKRYNPKGSMTKEERAHLEQVSQMPCIVTGSNQIQLHHIVECSRRLGHAYVLPLSVETHKDIYKIPFAEQIELCKLVYKKLGKEFKEPVTKIVGRV
jgi:hypothetical protein